MPTPTAAASLVFRSYAAGMNNAAEPSLLLRDDELSLIVNGTVRNGFVRTRPGWEHMVLSFADMNAQLQFEQGVYQGIGFFLYNNLRYYVVAVDGWLYFVDVNTFTVVRSASQSFSKFSPHVYFQQRNRWLIAQDGQSPAVVIDGYNLTQTTTATGVPTGTFMADGWHRLVVVSPDRHRIYISDHENNPNSTPISFTEGNQYFASASYFEGPPALGKIMGVRFTPYQDSSTGIGPLVVFFEKGIRAYNIATPRTQWTTTDISQTILPHTGSSSFMCYTDRGSDLMFRDQDGRIRSLRNAQQVYRNSGYDMPNDFPVWNLLRQEDTSLREYTCAATFDNRSLFSVFPRRRFRPDGRWCVIHDGLAVMENTHVATQGTGASISPRENVWAIWTGLPICGMTTGPVRGEESLVAFSCGADGRNRLHRLTRSKEYDVVSTSQGLVNRPIEMQIATGMRDYGNVSALKKVRTSAIWISDIVGNLNIQSRWTSDDSDAIDWFTHNEKHESCLTVGSCGLFTPTPSAQSCLILGSPPDSVNKFFKSLSHFKFTGCCTVNELQIDTEEMQSSTAIGTRCVPEPSAPAKPSCTFEVFDYDITKN